MKRIERAIISLTDKSGIEGFAKELSDLRIGQDSVEWYQQEIDRYHGLSDKYLEATEQSESSEKGGSEQNRNAEYKKLLVGFSESFQSN